MQICVHTNDKHYTTKELERPSFSTLNETTKYHNNALNKSIWAADTIYWKRESSYKWIDDGIMDKMISAALLESSLHIPLKSRRKTEKCQMHI